MSEHDVAFKSVQYLTRGYLRVTEVVGDRIRATCRGSRGQVYDLGYEPGRGWFCSCPARVYECCHVKALQKVVDDPAGRVAQRRSA